MAAYLFGDTDIAAQRLALVAEVYDASTRLFVQHWAGQKAPVVVDLGCGLGYTTRLLADVFQGEQTVGLDHSERFIHLARARQEAETPLVFHQHNITQIPFPVTPVDVLFCRLLLTHIEEPEVLIERWATQLRPGGYLLIEEVEWIETTSSIFTSYLEMQRALLTHQANCLDIGPILHRLPTPLLLQRRSSEVSRTLVSPVQAATMFALNFPTWSQHPFIQAQYESDHLQAIKLGLQNLMTAPPHDVEIEWGLRQIVYERV